MYLHANQWRIATFERQWRTILDIPEHARGQVVAAGPDLEVAVGLSPGTLRSQFRCHLSAEVHNSASGEIPVPAQGHFHRKVIAC